ncbi:MAG: hypothetical protein E7502_06205 [Ruminococcus sp.]|nr:hypothetical protein [Ruminococcus sp.]
MQHLFDPLPDGSGEFAGNVFIRREVTEEHRMEFEKDYMKEVFFRKRFKRFWLISEIVTLIIWLGSDFLNLHDDITFISGMYCIFCTPVLGVFVIVRNMIREGLLKRKHKKLLRRSMQEMRIPETAVRIEQIHPRGRKQMLCISHTGFDCSNYESFCFLENGMLCIADCLRCFEIPLSLLNSVPIEADWGKIHGWLQKKHPQTRVYRRHKVKCLGNDEFLVQFHRIEFWDNTGEYYFCIPNYELENFSELTKLQLYTD